MRSSKAARAAPAIDAARDPQNDGKIERTNSRLHGTGQAVILGHDPALGGANAFYFPDVDWLTVDDYSTVTCEFGAATAPVVFGATTVTGGLDARTVIGEFVAVVFGDHHDRHRRVRHHDRRRRVQRHDRHRRVRRRDRRHEFDGATFAEGIRRRPSWRA